MDIDPTPADQAQQPLPSTSPRPENADATATPAEPVIGGQGLVELPTAMETEFAGSTHASAPPLASISQIVVEETTSTTVTTVDSAAGQMMDVDDPAGVSILPLPRSTAQEESANSSTQHSSQAAVAAPSSVNHTSTATTTTTIEATLPAAAPLESALPITAPETPLSQSIQSTNLTNGDHSLPTVTSEVTHSSIPAGQPNPASQPSRSSAPSRPPESAQRDIASSSSVIPVMARTGYIYDKNMLMHCQDGYIPTRDDVEDNADGHPEEPMRIKRIFTRLRDAGLTQRMKQLPIKEVTAEQAALVHSADHWDKVQGTECELRLMVTSGLVQDLTQPSHDRRDDPRVEELLRGSIAIRLPADSHVCASVLRRCDTSLSCRVSRRSPDSLRDSSTSWSSCRAGRAHGFLFLQQRGCCGEGGAETRPGQEGAHSRLVGPDTQHED